MVFGYLDLKTRALFQHDKISTDIEYKYTLSDFTIS